MATLREWPLPDGTVYCDDHVIVGHQKRVLEEFERLRAMVERLPKTADGVPIVPGMMLFAVHFPCRVTRFEVYALYPRMVCDCDRLRFTVDECYSTRKAAEAVVGVEIKKRQR